MRYRYLLLLLAIFVPPLSSEVVTKLKPTVAPKPEALSAGTVRAAAAGPNGSYLLVQPSAPNTLWSVVSTDGRVVQLDLTGNRPVALSDRLAVWVEGSPLNSKLHVRSLIDNQKQTVTADIRAVFTLTVIDSFAYAVHQQPGTFHLSRIDLANGKVEKLDEFSATHEVFRFGDCSSDALILVDPVSAEFRTYALGPNIQKGPWVRIDSPLISAIKSTGPSSRATPSGKVFESALLAHKRGSGGDHFFLVAKGEKGVGQYLLRVNAEGRELARIVLEFPSGLKGFGPGFNAVLSTNTAMGFAHWTGAVITYGGVEQ